MGVVGVLNRRTRGRRVSALLCVFALGLAGAAGAQTAAAPAAPSSTLRVTVKDSTDLGIPGAVVTATGADRAARQTFTDGNGVALFEGLAPGRYDLAVEAQGFTSSVLDHVTMRRGARVSRELTLSIARFAEEVDVTPPALDQQLTDAFSTELSESQIAALPDDPDELLAALLALAGGDATIRVDGFLADALETGTEIRNIRIIQDGASAGAGGVGPRIEIRTEPGGDRWRGSLSGRLRDESLNGRNRFVTERPDGLTRSGSWSLNGPLVKHQTGLALSLERSQSVDQQAINAATTTGLLSTLVRQPADRLSIWAKVDQALGANQSLRAEVRQSNDEARNQGLSELDSPERALERTTGDGQLRLSHNMTIAKRHVHDARLQIRWRSTDAIPASLATALRVPGAISTGGAQQQGGRDTREVEYEDELMLALGRRHQVTTGFNAIGGHYAGDEWRNAGGTFTFASLEDRANGHPATYTQRIGDPSFAYSIYQFGAFVQDNYRVRKNVLLNLGLRHEWQSSLEARLRLLPRLGAQWSLPTRWRTSLSANYAETLQPFLGSLYEQTIVVNGTRQRDLVIAAPSYPDPFAASAVASAPPGVTRAGDELRAPSTRRMTVGVDQPVGRNTRLRANYTRQIGRALFRSRDINAPIDGVRPDPAFRNITELESSARSKSDALQVTLTSGYQPWRLNLNVSYSLGQAFNETDGALTLPPDSSRLDAEWGPSRQDIRHRLTASCNSDLRAGFRISSSLRAQSAAPYTITTGFDTNGDGVFNERPAGVARNSARGAGATNLDVTLTWNLNIGERPLPLRPVRGPTARRAPATAPRVRLEVYAQSNNVLNAVNLQSFNGVQTSPLFGLATAAAQGRRLTFGTRVSF